MLFVVAPASFEMVKKFGSVGERLDNGTMRSAVFAVGKLAVAA